MTFLNCASANLGKGRESSFLDTTLGKFVLFVVIALLPPLSLPGAGFAGFSQQGLVGIGRLSAESFDAQGPKIDTLGAIFSAMALDPVTWTQTINEAGLIVHHGLMYGLADRGAGGGAGNYKPRIQELRVTLAPHFGTTRTNQTQIRFTNTASILFTDENGLHFTGFDANDSAAIQPRARLTSRGEGRRSLDPEGLVRLPTGEFFVSDEYGPFVYALSRTGQLKYVLTPPPAYLPKVGSSFGSRRLNFSSLVVHQSGRRNNRGFEGLTITPDGKRLVAVLQSPLVQDAGTNNDSRNTRLLFFDIDARSDRFQKPVAEFVYQLTLRGNEEGSAHTIIGDITAINEHQFLVLEHDGRGLGAEENGPPLYKRIVLVDLDGATDIINTGYDLELGAPGQLSFRKANLPSSVRPVQRQDFIDLLDSAQLSKFRLNLNSSPNNNTISEKWEGLAIIPAQDAGNSDAFFVLVGNDNDFQTDFIYHNGEIVDRGGLVDHMLLAYRVTLPGYNPLVLPTGPPPALTIARGLDRLEIVWPRLVADYILQTSIGTTFSDWTNLSSVSNQWTVLPTNHAQFFRLIRE